ncbi:IPTL-CTERM sorting domain-containing protein [Acidovorax sp. MR-S7]|uniref:IPTL-CTERM sorting domain-containing protein n=1 Tax=Acidovorax sp. MR-S7 TaxID=1268622 RepID=UPI00036B403A|nr:IPTL-CTERM sorting domain-containing protein [Acidovorax sp. MR-S7]GAD23278.1 hypothetical protein AVS7_03038 [Acidovorax sp. MR-S7]
MKNPIFTLLSAALLTLAASATATAAPFATTYQGRVGFTTMTGVPFDTPYTVTLIMDNGGTTAGSQAWNTVACAIWRIGGTRVYIQAGPGANSAATTLADGSLWGFFSAVTGTGDGIGSASNYTATGFSPALAIPVVWQANGQAPVFTDSAGQGFSDADTSTGIGMAGDLWSTPQRVTAACDDTPYAAPPSTPNATPVPTLGHGALALLGAGLGALGLWRRRRG